jgi:hypothetical protein
MRPVVFVWKSYGDVSVYAADTIEQLTELVNQLETVFESLGLRDKYYTFLNDLPDTTMTVIQYKEFITELLEDEIGTHESFENGTGFTRVVGA